MQWLVDLEVSFVEIANLFLEACYGRFFRLNDKVNVFLSDTSDRLHPSEIG